MNADVDRRDTYSLRYSHQRIDPHRTLIIERSVDRLIKVLLILIAMSLASAYLIAYPETFEGKENRAYFGGWFCLFVFSPWIPLVIARFINDGQAPVRLSPSGFSDRRVEHDELPWTAVESIEHIQRKRMGIRSGEYVLIHLREGHDGDSATEPEIRFVNQGTLNISTRDLFDALEFYWRHHTQNTAPNTPQTKKQEP